MQLGLFGSFITNLFIVSHVFTSSDCGGLQQQIILQLPQSSFVIPYFMFLYDRVLHVLLQPHLISEYDLQQVIWSSCVQPCVQPSDDHFQAQYIPFR